MVPCWYQSVYRTDVAGHDHKCMVCGRSNDLHKNTNFYIMCHLNCYAIILANVHISTENVNWESHHKCPDAYNHWKWLPRGGYEESCLPFLHEVPLIHLFFNYIVKPPYALVCTFPLIFQIWRCHHEHPDTNKQRHMKQQSKGEGEKIIPWPLLHEVLLSYFYLNSSERMLCASI